MARKTDQKLSTLSVSEAEPFFDQQTSGNTPTVYSGPEFDEDETPDQALLQTLAMLGEDESESKVMVYRLTDGKPDAYLKKFSPSEFAATGMEELQRDYGGGTFRVRVYRPNGRGLAANQKIAIESAKENLRAMVPVNPQAEIGALATALASAMSSGFEKIGQMIAATNRPVDSRMDFLKEISVMKDLFSPSVSPAQNEVGAIDMFMKGIEFAKNTIPKEGETNAIDFGLEMLRTFGPSFAEAAKSMQPAGSPSLPQISSPSAGGISELETDAGSHPVAGNGEPGGNGAMNIAMQARLKGAVGFLVSQAARDNDPVTYAYMVLDQVPEETLKQLIEAPDWIDRLAGINPKVREYEQWFNEMRITIMAEFSGGLTSEAATAQTTEGQEGQTKPES